MDIRPDCEVVHEFTCNECYHYMEPPIRMCPNSHCFCDTCFNVIQMCTTCKRTEFIRNLPLERIFEKMLFPCIYIGCDFEGNGRVIKNHEELCKFGMCCPFVGNGCMWRGSFNSLEYHIKSNHKLVEKLNVPHTLNDYEGGGTWREIIKIEEELFLACFVKNSVEFKFGVYRLNPNDLDDSFEYQITFKGDWEKIIIRVSGPCIYFINYHEKDIDETNSYSLPKKVIDSYCSQEKIFYNLTIKRN